MTVHFIGAGPGAADLVTVRGRDLIAAAPVVLYAGSLVAPAMLEWARGDARVIDTAPLTLDEIVATATRVRADGVDLNANLDVIDEAFVARLRAEGLEFHAWTVNDAGAARRLIDLGVDSITTDRPGWLREQLESQ